LRISEKSLASLLIGISNGLMHQQRQWRLEDDGPVRLGAATVLSNAAIVAGNQTSADIA